MAERDIVRKVVPYKNVVKEPGFNYRKNLPPIPVDIRALLHENIKRAQGVAREKGDDAGKRVKVFEWPKIDKLIEDNKELIAPQRVKLRRVLALSQNIYRQGMTNPLTVRESGADRDDNRTYFLVAGERRFLACEAIGITQVEVKVVKGDKRGLRRLRISENLQREDPDPFEEAEALAEILNEEKEDGTTQASLAEEMGVSEAYISQRLSMLRKSTPELRAAVEINQISTAHVREIATLPAKEQNTLLDEIKEKLAKGEKVTAADVKDKTDARKVQQRAVKDEAKRVSKNGRGKDDSDGEDRRTQVDAVRNAGYDPAKFEFCTKRDVVKMLVVEAQRLERIKSDRGRSEQKGKIQALEAVLGLRSLS